MSYDNLRPALSVAGKKHGNPCWKQERLRGAKKGKYTPPDFDLINN
jgi:hypothetical protein